jgi:hypothetical protein
MKQHTSSHSPKVAGIALALFGLSAILGLGPIGEAQAGQPALSQSFVTVDRAGTGGYQAILAKRSPGESKCPRSADGCDKRPICPPEATVCPKPS